MKEVDTKDNGGNKRGDRVMDSKHKLKKSEAQKSVIRWASAVTRIFHLYIS